LGQDRVLTDSTRLYIVFSKPSFEKNKMNAFVMFT
jgi:hypothetical protein